jgi:exopolysaccharide biosynthesis polyprenyl glycosylphosphotransferase
MVEAVSRRLEPGEPLRAPAPAGGDLSRGSARLTAVRGGPGLREACSMAVAAALVPTLLGPAAGESAPTAFVRSLYAASVFATFLAFAGGRRARLTTGAPPHPVLRLLTALSASLAFGALAASLAGWSVPPSFHWIVAGSGLALMIGYRSLGWLVPATAPAPAEPRSIILVGRNPRAARIAREVLHDPRSGIRILGIVDAPAARTNGSSDPSVLFREGPLAGVPFLGMVDRLPRIVTQHPVDEVVVTLPLRSCYDHAAHVQHVCEQAGIDVSVLPDAFEPRETRSEVHAVGGVPVVTRCTSPRGGPSLAVKRGLDLLVSGGLLLLLAPVMGAIALLVRRSSPGPVLFRQVRVGRRGRRFTLLKFRTMVVDAERLRPLLEARNQVDGPVFKMRDDPRITAVGRFLRKYHLDELPQLWNVFRGDMSLVGPRPPVPEEVARYELRQRRRLSMPMGITCHWQVSRDRHLVSFRKWVDLDLKYVDGWTLGSDLRLLLRTIPAVLRGGGW